MGIWLDQLEQEVRAEAGAVLHDRRALRLALANQHAVVHEDGAPDAALLIVDALPRPGSAAEDGQQLLRAELAQLPYEGFALRQGQLAMLLPGPVDPQRVKRLLTRLNRRLQLGSRGRHLLVFGAARAAEARRNAADWLALADLRLQLRLTHLGQPVASRRLGQSMPRHQDRRQTGLR